MDSDASRPIAVRLELERVLSSPRFARNERLSRFLRFVVERHLEGRAEELKESVIAVEVFGRRPDHDPRLDSIVRTEAGRLRARLLEYYAAEGGTDPVVIEVPKGGYVPVFRHVEAGREAAAPRRRRGRFVAIVALLGAALTAAASWWAGRPAAPITIAVLPLENLTPVPGSDYFADGLTDEIIRNLSVIDGLTVRSRTSSFALKGRPRNVQEAGRLLAVGYLVEGSVLRTAGRLRVNAQLVRVRDGLALWAGKFDRDLTDVFAVQDEISLGIVNNLRLRLGRGRRRYESSVEAYDLFLRAHVLTVPTALVEQPVGPANMPGSRFEHSVRSFERALEKDPSFAPAWAGLAATHAMRSVAFPLDHPADELPAMRAAAERACDLDPLLPEAHASLGLAHARDGHWEQAERSFRRALELDRNRSATYKDYAYWLLAVLGRHDEAVEHLRTAQQLDPLSADVRLTLALVLLSAGRYGEAADECRALPVAGECLSRIASARGDFDEAVRLMADHPGLAEEPADAGLSRLRVRAIRSLRGSRAHGARGDLPERAGPRPGRAWATRTGCSRPWDGWRRSARSGSDSTSSTRSSPS